MFSLNGKYRDREFEERQKQLEKSIIEERIRRRAAREERVRSLSPEKFPAVHSTQRPSTSKNLSEVTLSPPSSSSLSSSKAEEIQKTIERIAGPTGTLKLFPSSASKSQSNEKVKDIPEPQKGENKTEKTDIKDLERLKNLDLNSSSPPSLEKLVKSDSSEKLPKKNDDTFEPPKLRSITSLKKKDEKLQPKDTSETADDGFLNVKLKRIVNEQPPVSNHKQEAASTTPSALPLKKIAAKIPPPKPRSLSSQKTEIKKPIEKDALKDTELTTPMEPKIKEEEKLVTPEKEQFKLKTDVTSLENIIHPASDSSKLGLRKFKPTEEHNDHKITSSNMNGKVPMVGMINNTKSLTSTPVSQSRRLEKKMSVLPSPQNNRASILGLSHTLSPSENATNTPAGSFLASRPQAVSIPRARSPVRGGFVQSAMMKRESMLDLRPRSDSSSSLTSPNFTNSGLGSPISITDSNGPRSPTPSKHLRNNSIQSIESVRSNSFVGQSAIFGGKLPSKSEKQSPESPSKSDEDIEIPGTPENNDVGSHRTKGSVDLGSTPPSVSPSTSLKSTDSRRWAPSKQTWLESALLKNNNSSLDNYVHRTSTISRSPSPKKSINNQFALKDNNTKPILSPSQFIPHRAPKPLPKTPQSNLDSPKLHSVHLSERALDEPEQNNSTVKAESVPVPPPPRKVSSSSEVKSELPLEPKAPTLGRSATLSGKPKAKPAVPKKPDFSNKPNLPSDALEKLRALRSGMRTPQPNPVKEEESDTDKIKASLRRNNTIQYQSSGIRRNPRPIPPKSLASQRTLERVQLSEKPEEEEEEEEEETPPPLPSRRGLALEDPPAPALPPRKHIISKPAPSLPSVPDSLKVRQEPIIAKNNEDPVVEAKRILYGKSKEEKEEEEKFYSGATIPSVLNKVTAKGFASDLASVLQKGSPLVPLNNTDKSFSPRFERMVGIHKSKTFDSSELYESSNDGKDQKVELTHMTKSRAKGPKRRLPKTVGSGKSTSEDTLRVPRTRNNNTTRHQRQRSRSLSPDFAASINRHDMHFNTSRPSSVSRDHPQLPQESNNSSDDGINPSNDLSTIFLAKPVSRGPNAQPQQQEEPLVMPKVRKPLPPTPGSLKPSSSNTQNINKPPPIRKSSKTVTQALQQQQQEKTEKIPPIHRSPVSRKPVIPVPAKPRNLSASFN